MGCGCNDNINLPLNVSGKVIKNKKVTAYKDLTEEGKLKRERIRRVRMRKAMLREGK